MELANIFIFGLGIVGIGILVLGAVLIEVKKNMRGSAAMMIGVGLGMGIFAFSAKLALIVAYLSFGDTYLAYFLDDKKEAEEFQPVVYKHDAEPKNKTVTVGYQWEPLPKSAPVPKDNPMSLEKVALGRMLFNDVRLSADNSVSCASCHDINTKGGADGLPVSVGIFNQNGSRNAPTVINAAFQSVLFWDGRAKSLEEQAKGPITNPIEMGMESHRAVEQKLRNIPNYQSKFKAVFGGEDAVSIDNIAKAIAAYERTLITPNAPYDRFLRGDTTAMTTQQVRGMGLFAEFGCINCHRGPNFSDASLIGGSSPYRMFPSVSDTEYEVNYKLIEDKGFASTSLTGDAHDRGIWRIPSLRNVTRTAPYFHNGSVTDLKEAVRIMARVQLDKPSSNAAQDDWRVNWVAGKNQTKARSNAVISDAEVDDIVAFLRALEDEPIQNVTLASMDKQDD